MPLDRKNRTRTVRNTFLRFNENQFQAKCLDETRHHS